MRSHPRIVILFATIAVVGWIGSVLAGLFGDQLIERRSTEPGAWSRSALGHIGLIEWLAFRGFEPILVRSPASLHSARQTVLFALEPRANDPTAQLNTTRLASRKEPTLLVLPRRSASETDLDPGTNARDPGWIAGHTELTTAAVGEVSDLAGVPCIVERPSAPQEFRLPGSGAALLLDAPQCVRSEDITPIVSTPAGILFGQVSSRPGWYILSDPDLIANHGIVDPSRRAVLDFICERMSIPKGATIAIDETIHGATFERDVWREALGMPLLPMTLSVLLVAALTALAARRFLSPLDTPAAWSVGKRALIDNTAELEATANRLDPLVKRYQDILERSLADALGIEECLSQTQRRSEIQQRTARLELAPESPPKLEDGREIRNDSAGTREALANMKAWKRWHDEVILGSKRY